MTPPLHNSLSLSLKGNYTKPQIADQISSTPTPQRESKNTKKFDRKKNSSKKRKVINQENLGVVGKTWKKREIYTKHTPKEKATIIFRFS